MFKWVLSGKVVMCWVEMDTLASDRHVHVIEMHSSFLFFEFTCFVVIVFFKFQLLDVSTSAVDCVKGIMTCYV